MNIQILDSSLREYIKTAAKPSDISKILSLTSVSVERIEKTGDDYLYDIEVTTNRVDLMSVVGIARELAAALSQNGIKSEFIEKKYAPLKTGTNELLDIQVEKNLTNRVTAAILDVTVSDSPKFMVNMLSKSGIRSLNNLIDITNYIMREIGHPAHVFDYDRLGGKKIIIRESQKGETITTLDEKTHVLKGGDIIATDGEGRIIDLLGIMGLENSVVTNDTKRIVLFFDNNNAKRIRKTSMGLGIRTEAAVLNEKNVDPELITFTMQRGIELYKKYANGKLVGNVIDIYTNKPGSKKIKVRKSKISQLIGVEIEDESIKKILEKLSFKVACEKSFFTVTPPSGRSADVAIEEDVVEEIARIYGYHKIPNSLPPINNKAPFNQKNGYFYWENRAKDALKYWGFNEVYTYSMVSENLYEGPLETAVKIANPLSEEHVYMRNTLVPSLLEVSSNNYVDEMRLFEIANVYKKRRNDLPEEILHLAIIIKKESADIFFEAKGILISLLEELGIKNYDFKKRSEGGAGADVFVDGGRIGDIELLEQNLVNLEVNFRKLTDKATDKKVFKPIAQYPPVIEDIRVEVKPETEYKKIIDTIYASSETIKNVQLIDEYENKKTFRITFQDKKKNLSNDDVAPLREKLIESLRSRLKAKIG